MTKDKAQKLLPYQQSIINKLNKLDKHTVFFPRGHAKNILIQEVTFNTDKQETITIQLAQFCGLHATIAEQRKEIESLKSLLNINQPYRKCWTVSNEGTPSKHWTQSKP